MSALDQQPRVSRPPADPLRGGETLEELLVAHRAATAQLLSAHDELVSIVSHLREPAKLEKVDLSTAVNPFESGPLEDKPTLSVGLFNPSGSLATVNLGIVGSAGAADAIPVPAGKLLILPCSARAIEVGTNFAFGAGQTLFCWLLRYFTVQPAYYGG